MTLNGGKSVLIDKHTSKFVALEKFINFSVFDNKVKKLLTPDYSGNI
jgi:hypothetical protein